jgi:hypothetical protein
MKKRNLPLGLRTARRLLLLGAVLALGAALLFVPRWMTEGRVREAMREDCLTGGEVLWRGRVPFPYGGAYMTVLEQNGQLYAGWLESYEGRPYIVVRQRETAGEPVVTLTQESTYLAGDNRVLFQAMVLNLPEGTEAGRLTVDLGPGDMRTVDSQRDRGVMMFPVPRREGEQVPRNAGYTLTLWDGAGAEVGRTAGRLGEEESLWR